MNFVKVSLADAGTTGNNTGAATYLADRGKGVAVQFVVEVAGGTPTVTWKVQGSVDGTNWYDCAYRTDSSDTTAVATIASTAVGAKIINIVRQYQYYRVVTTANTNITYRAEAYMLPEKVV